MVGFVAVSRCAYPAGQGTQRGMERAVVLLPCGAAREDATGGEGGTHFVFFSLVV